ncbi:MAG: LamG-like jellyroll fold domain-containing protein, partial [Eubacteriales bacterium]
YVKAFPYASGYNQTIGKHEKTVSVGSLVAEWTVDSDVPNDDTAGERNLSTTGIGTEPGKVGNALVGSNGYAMMANEIDMGGNTLTFWLWPTGTDTGLFGDTTAVHVYALIESNALTFGAYNHLETYGINSGEYYFVAFTFSGDSVNLFVNGEFIKSVIASSSTYSRIIDTIGRASVGGTGTTNYRKMNCHMDQIRIFQGLLTTDDLENLYNDGAGC